MDEPLLSETARLQPAVSFCNRHDLDIDSQVRVFDIMAWQSWIASFDREAFGEANGLHAGARGSQGVTMVICHGAFWQAPLSGAS